MTGSLFRTALILGLLSAVGPFAIDMYLPAMPAIAADLGATPTQVQATLISFFVAFGIAQLVYGPWADQSGRKPPLYFGLVLFIAASLGSALASDIGALTAWRFVQGLGAAVVMVIPRAIIRDMHTGHEGTRLMAMVMLVISVSPMLAPLAGSGILKITGWQGIFIVITVAAVASLLLTLFVQPETLAPENRVRVNLHSLMRGTRTLFADPVFMGLTFLGAFAFASFFVFIASASFVYTNEFGLTPTGFSLAFALNAIGFFAASQFAAGLGQRFGARPVVLWATAGFALAAAATFGLGAAGFASLGVVVGGLLLANACLGLVIPTVMVMALDDHGEIAGLASSLGGTLQMLTGGLVTVAAGPFFDGTAQPMLAAIALCGVVALVLALLVPGRKAAVA